MEHINAMQDGAIISNSGHFDVEIDVEGLEKKAKKKREIRELVDEYTLSDGRRIVVIGGGRLVNLATAEGHPSAVMDMSFANQALAAEYLVNEAKNLDKKVYPVPQYLDDDIAKLKLESLGVDIDSLTAEQEEYLSSWQFGT
jgi:adenosylhomocysteinase